MTTRRIIATVSVTAEPNGYAVWLFNSAVGDKLLGLHADRRGALTYAREFIRDLTGQDVELDRTQNDVEVEL